MKQTTPMNMSGGERAQISPTRFPSRRFRIVPRGVAHLPVTDDEALVLLFEPAATRNTGNVDNDRTVTDLERI